MMGKREPVTPAVFWTKLGLSAALVLLGGVFAGLTLGLMGLDELHLKVLSSSSADETERSNAAKGMSVRSG
jgi:metal transporter CNNM